MKAISQQSQLFAIRFIPCLGVGGCWPNGVALVSEAWSNFARPIIASMIGMAGNIGIFAFSSLLVGNPVTPDSFRWVFLVGACSLPLGILILFLVPESPTWLAARQTVAEPVKGDAPRPPSVFRKPYLGATIAGIALATVPLFGGWASFQWIVFWAGKLGKELGPPELEAQILQMRAITSIVGSGLAAVIAMWIGRRTAATIILTPTLIARFGGGPAQIGRITSLIFVVGMVAILFAPDTNKRDMKK